jgi:hypothetical protein
MGLKISSPFEILASVSSVLLVSPWVSCLVFWSVAFVSSCLSSVGLLIRLGRGILIEEA